MKIFDPDSIDMITESPDGIELWLNAYEGFKDSKDFLEEFSAKLRAYAEFVSSEDFHNRFGHSKARIRIVSFSDPTLKVQQFVQEVSRVTNISITFEKFD